MELVQQLVNWRRDLHRHPEQGFLEMRTASIVAGILNDLDFELKLGKEVMVESACMGKPDAKTTASHIKWAQENGANEIFRPFFKEGYTSIVATFDTNRPGPTIAFRFDMSALPI